MRNVVLFFLGGIMMASCVHSTTEHHDGQAEEITDGVFIHITAGYDDAHRALMPLKMATLMADDKDVLVYMDIHAVNMLVEGAEDLTHDGFESARTYIDQLLEKGVGIYACPTCLQVAGFQADDLIDGVQTAQKDKFFNFTKGRILTLDY